ncbi:MAG: hypothetical protein Q7T87_22105 [Polaromonas sp.]|nr:hypothetical protein [Polaromonas sp.]
MDACWPTIDAYLLRLDDGSPLATLVPGTDGFAKRLEFRMAVREITSSFASFKMFNDADKNASSRASSSSASAGPAGPSRVQGPRSLIALWQADLRVQEAVVKELERLINAHKSGEARLTKEALDAAEEDMRGTESFISHQHDLIAWIRKMEGAATKPTATTTTVVPSTS